MCTGRIVIYRRRGDESPGLEPNRTKHMRFLGRLDLRAVLCGRLAPVVTFAQWSRPASGQITEPQSAPRRVLLPSCVAFDQRRDVDQKQHHRSESAVTVVFCRVLALGIRVALVVRSISERTY